jgi:Tol biopolymer transport system component
VKKAAVIGEPFALGDRLLGTGFSGAAGISVAQNGTLVYTTNVDFATHLVWADKNGRPASSIPVAPGKYIGAEISPDGTEAVLESSTRMGVSELWLANLERGVVTRLSYDAGENSNARWSPDGTRVAYTSSGLGGYQKIIVASVTGGASRTYLENDPVFKNISGWTPDGRTVVYARQSPETRWDIWLLPVDGESPPTPYLATPYYEDRGSVSPDGRWMVYRSDESGAFDLYVQAFPGGGGKYKVTNQGGAGASWTRDGRRMKFGKVGDPTGVFVADVLAGPKFQLGPARLDVRIPETLFDVEETADDRLMYLIPVRPLPPQSVTIVQNWPSLLPAK